MMLRNVRNVLCGAALALLALPAAAMENPAGTYTGKMKCDTLDAGVPVKAKSDVTIRLVLEKDSARLAIDVTGGASFVSLATGRITENADKTDRGKFLGLTCTIGAVDPDGASVHADLVIKPGSAKGSIKGTVHVHRPGSQGACSFSGKRTSPTAEVFLCE
jgi:hypothetical protein